MMFSYKQFSSLSSFIHLQQYILFFLTSHKISIHMYARVWHSEEKTYTKPMSTDVSQLPASSTTAFHFVVKRHHRYTLLLYTSVPPSMEKLAFLEQQKYKAGINLPFVHRSRGSSHLKESIKPSVFLHYRSCKRKVEDYGKGGSNRALCKTFARELDINV